MAGGNVDNEGRVEICLSNEWGRICDDNWSTNDADVVCGALGFSSTGKFILPVFLNFVHYSDYHVCMQGSHKICFTLKLKLYALPFQMHWHLVLLTLLLELDASSLTMSAALVQSLLFWTVLMIPVLVVSVTMKMLE